MTDLARQLADILRIDGARWRAFATLDPDLLRRQPEPGEWSALQVISHAADTESAVFAARVRAILAGEPAFRGWDPDVEATPVTDATDPVEVADRQGALRVESIRLVEGIVDADLDRTSLHADLGVVSLRELLNEFACHDLNHLVQAERAVMQPFILASGPWRSFFEDHDVGARRSSATPAG